MKQIERMKRIGISLLALLAAQTFAAQSHGSMAAETGSVRLFVQSFYDWYTPKVVTVKSGPAWDLALKSKTTAFSPALFKALREDSAASAKAKGEIVGLDFDPILNSQDPAGHYKVGKVVRKGETYLVSVYSVLSGKPSSKAAVVAQLTLHRGNWQFANFLYPGRKDLIQALKDLKKERG